MWRRSELKERAKKVFKANYWKCVVAGLILAIAVGGSGSAGTASSQKSNEEAIEEIETFTNILIENKGIIGNAEKETQFEEDVHGLENELKKSVDGLDLEPDEKVAAGVVVALSTVFIAILGLVVNFFVLNPLLVGCRGFFVKNLSEEAELGETLEGFKTEYKRNVKGMCLVDVKTVLWTALFIIPGIVKAYEYRMIPYILSQDSEISVADAFKKSAQMMKGQKWNAFVLDLSFIGWNLLSLMTCGLLGLFYVEPYKAQTSAALYDELNKVA